MNNRIVFIIPYFGKFNNYFELYLKSCEINSNLCDWLIFTDDKRNFNYPQNVKVKYVSWPDMVNYIRSKVDFKIKLERPYKLCDYRPLYGKIFSEFIKGYDFWGYCDTDLIWGKISDFVTSDILNSYDKIFDFGHCTIIRNNKKNNTIFKTLLNGRKRYLEVLQTESNCSFDEEYNLSINSIYEYKNISIYKQKFAANLYT